MDGLRRILQQHSEAPGQHASVDALPRHSLDLATRHELQPRQRSQDPALAQTPVADDDHRVIQRRPLLELTNHMPDGLRPIQAVLPAGAKLSSKSEQAPTDRLLLDHVASASDDVRTLHAAHQRALDEVASLADALRQARLKSAKLSVRLAAANRSNDASRHIHKFNVRVKSRSNAKSPLSSDQWNDQALRTPKDERDPLCQGHTRNQTIIPLKYMQAVDELSSLYITSEEPATTPPESCGSGVAQVPEHEIRVAALEARVRDDVKRPAQHQNELDRGEDAEDQNPSSISPSLGKLGATVRSHSSSHSSSAQTQVSGTANSSSMSQPSNESIRTSTIMTSSISPPHSMSSHDSTKQSSRTHTCSTNGTVEEKGTDVALERESPKAGAMAGSLSRTQSVTTDTVKSVFTKRAVCDASNNGSKSSKKRPGTQRVDQSCRNDGIESDRKERGMSNRGVLPRRAYSRRTLRAAAKRHARRLATDGQVSSLRVWPAGRPNLALQDAKLSSAQVLQK